MVGVKPFTYASTGFRDTTKAELSRQLCTRPSSGDTKSLLVRDGNSRYFWNALSSSSPMLLEVICTSYEW